ncbi:hypothetical protein Tco_1363867 [Tanacetum coccineum]
MPYPRFTKVIIDHFISKDNTISMRNRINLHTARDDSLLGALKFVSKIEDCQKYGALIPDGMINDDIKLSTAYKTYLDYATGKVPPKKARKFKKPASPKLKTVLVSPKEPTQKGKRVKRPAKKATTSPNNRCFHQRYFCEDETDDFNDEDDDGGDDDDSGNDDNSDEEDVHTPEKDKSDDEEKMYEEEDDDVVKELYGDLNITQGLKDTDMTNAEQGGEDQQNASHESGFVQQEDDGHVTLTTVHDKTEGTMQSYSVSSDFTSKLLNLDNTSPNVNEIASLMNTSTVPPSPPLINPSLYLTTISQQQTPDSTTTTTNPTMTLPEIPNFDSLFHFDQREPALETKMSEFNQTSQFFEVVSSISGIIDQYLASKIKEVVDVAVRLQSNKLKEEAKAENQEIEKYVTESLGAEVLVRSTNQPQMSYVVATSLSEFELKKILIDKMETNKSINSSDI